MTEATGESSSGEKLWAGKYKSAEEMETALLAQNKEVYKLIDQNKQLSSQVKTVTLVPDVYKVPANLEWVKDEVNDLTVMAKNSGLSQEAFEKFVTELNTKRSVENENFEEQKKAIGQDNLNVITDYVKKNYPESVQKDVLNKFIRDSEARKQALNDRNKKLDTRVPGMDRANSGEQGNSHASKEPEAYDGQNELLKLGKEVEANPSNTFLREKMINLAKEVGHARGLGQK